MPAFERLPPAFHEKVWGSRELSPWFPDRDTLIGEVWFQRRPPLPILVKFLFTTDKLSVQVHPGGATGKTEMWHILRAGEGAAVALGFREPVSPERLREASLSGEIEHLLEWFPVKPGDTYFTPAGTVHAIGRNIALCEIQQNSDITYRLYDYGRPRELHLEQGAAVSYLGPHPGASPECEVRCEYFETTRLTLDGRYEFRPSGSPVELLIAIDGSGRIGGELFRAGEVFLMHGAAAVEPEGSAVFLHTQQPW